MTTSTKKRNRPTVEQLQEKYPNFSNEFSKNWRPILKKALSEQERRNPNSKSLRGIKEVAKTHFSFYLENDEWDKVVDIISQKFKNNKMHETWDEWRQKLPNIFKEQKIGRLYFSETDEGQIKVGTIDASIVESGCAVIIIQHNNFRAEYSNVPVDVALTINSELSKSLA
jgi:hypothetical protein